MSKDMFKDMLDGLVTQEEAPPPVEEVPVAVTGNGLADDDPYKHLVGRQMAEQELLDPFTAMLDGMLAQEGMSKETPLEGRIFEIESHDWVSEKMAIYEGDEILMTCSKCCRAMRVTRHETTNSAMDRHQIARDCSMQTVGEVMND